MGKNIESREFRKFARLNCYRYGCLDIYTTSDVTLDTHKFPSYSTTENSSALEKFLVLIQGLGTTSSGNDPANKLPRMLPTVQWGGDSLGLSISLNGTMYFRDFSDYNDVKRKLRNEMLSQGWTVNTDTLLGIPITSYQPTNSGSGSLYADDPIDAAGMAMMVNAMQHTTAELEVMSGLMNKDVESYASGMAKKDGRRQGESQGLAGFGFTGNFKAGLEAIGTNSSGGLVGKWKTSGHPVQLIIDGRVARESINCVLTDADFTESAFTVDSTSGGNVYPTQMEVKLTVTNLYGSMLTTMTGGK